jgi:hypothetical protein
LQWPAQSNYRLKAEDVRSTGLKLQSHEVIQHDAIVRTDGVIAREVRFRSDTNQQPVSGMSAVPDQQTFSTLIGRPSGDGLDAIGSNPPARVLQYALT